MRSLSARERRADDRRQRERKQRAQRRCITRAGRQALWHAFRVAHVAVVAETGGRLIAICFVLASERAAARAACWTGLRKRTRALQTRASGCAHALYEQWLVNFF